MKPVLVPTTKYNKDLKRCKKRGWDMTLLDEALDLIVAGKKLPENYQKHELSGNRVGQIDIHIKPNWILLYEPFTYINELDNKTKQAILLRRTGTHSDLFNK